MPPGAVQGGRLRDPRGQEICDGSGDGIGKEHKFSGEKLTTLLALYRYEGDFENALKMMDEIYKVGEGATPAASTATTMPI